MATQSSALSEPVQQLEPKTPYSALEVNHLEIRLLSLAPGEFDDDLVITLRVVRLGTRPKYDALSYAWETGDSLRKASVNGVPMSVGKNLDSGLRHLRHSHAEPKLIWIDAICINQTDFRERSLQVRLMGVMYSFAEPVIVWLGPKQPSDKEALDWIKSGQAPDQETHERMVRLHVSVCERSWFRRLWVLQELALAQKDPLLYLGRRTVL